MRASELRDLSDQELDVKERELKEDLVPASPAAWHEPAGEPGEICVHVRRDIARDPDHSAQERAAEQR